MLRWVETDGFGEKGLCFREFTRMVSRVRSRGWILSIRDGVFGMGGEGVLGVFQVEEIGAKGLDTFVF